MKPIIQVLIADDHPVFRTGLRQIIESDGQFRILHEASDGREAIAMIDHRAPDVVVLDVDMPLVNGIEVVRHVRRAAPDVGIVMLTMYKEEAMFNKIMDLGVHGYVLKENAVSDILACLKAVVEGRYYISPTIGEYLVRRSGRTTQLPSATGGIVDLTPTERRVMRLLAEHRTSQAIADEMSISIKTVQRHRENISRKLGLRGPHALLTYALEHRQQL